MDTSNLANRMKEYEKRNQYYLQRRTPVAIRVDGRSFHTFAKGFQRPFDEILMTAMQNTAKYMCENIQGAKFAYVQSDEITIILVDYDTLETDCWFNYRTDKLCSIAASMATVTFNRYFSYAVDEYSENWNTDSTLLDTYYKALEKGAMFDARCFNIPKEEVANLIYWRQLDATRNSIQMVGQANFSHKELQNKSCNDIQNMLLTQKDINWNDYPIYKKRGSACIKVEMIDNFKFNAMSLQGGEGIITESHTEWIIDKEMPIIKDDRNYIEQYIYVGE